MLGNTHFYCSLCNKNEDEVELIDIASNSLKCGDEIIEFADLLIENFHLKFETGFICTKCQNQMIQFHFFKMTVSMNNMEINQRAQIMKKLILFLDDCDSIEDLAVLRYNKCFAIAPESKRKLMENFQNWQPRVLTQKIENQLQNKQELVKGETKTENIICIETETKSNSYDEIIMEDEQENTIEMMEQEFIETEFQLEDSIPANPTKLIKSEKSKPSKEQREWANETTKACYSIKESEDGVVPIWSCSVCCKVYRSAQALRLHLLAKHLKAEEDLLELTQEMQDWIANEYRERRVLIETVDGNTSEWTCGICNFTCTAGEAFRSHLVDMHMKNKNSHIAVSSERKLDYQQQQQWILSQIKHEIDKDWTCLKCEFTFKTEKQLKQHLMQHVLTLTTDEFESAVKMETQRPRKAKTIKFQWTCRECWFQFSAQRSFDSHMRLHDTLKGMNPFTVVNYCEECQMFFRNVEDLAIHVEAHAEGLSSLVPAEGIALQKTILFKRLPVPLEAQEGKSTCGHCGRKFEGEINCKSHLLIHHVNPLVCPKDGRQFYAMQPYICHLQKVHSDMFPESLLCTHCRMNFDNIYDRLAHMKQCDEKKFYCDHCNKKFSNKNYLNSHLKREMGLLSCTCQVCGKILKAKDELKIHLRTHTKEKPFKCSICEKRYTTTSARASHMETHKDTVIQCEACSVRFVARRHYVVHYKRYHDEVYRQRKFQEQTCQLCGKQFLRKDRLREHMQKVHNSECI